MADAIEFGDARVPGRFWLRFTIAPSGCWEWTGPLYPNGYGATSLTRDLVRTTGLRRNERTHRLMYALLVGGIARGREQHIDHLCRNRRCANPEHLELVAAQVNIDRGEFQKRRQTICHRGHSLTDRSLAALFDCAVGLPVILAVVVVAYRKVELPSLRKVAAVGRHGIKV